MSGNGSSGFLLEARNITKTFGDLRADPGVQELWRRYAEEEEPAESVPWGKWQR